MTYREDPSSDEVINNWNQALDLTCKDNYHELVGLLGVILVIGFFFGSIFLTPLADIYGRKKLNWWLTIIWTVPVILLTFLQQINAANYAVFCVLIFINGCATAPRFNISAMYSCEYTTEEKVLLYNFNA